MTDPQKEKQEKLTQAVRARMKGLGLDALFHQVDITQKDSTTRRRNQPKNEEDAALLKRSLAQDPGRLPFLRETYAQLAQTNTPRQVAISVGEKAIKILDFETSPTKTVITRVRYLPVPHQVTTTPENYETFITQTLTEQLGQRTGAPPALTLLIPRCDTVVKFLTLPSTDLAEIRKMIDFEIEHHLPFPQAEADYQVLRRDGARSQVLLAAVPSADLTRQLAVFEKIGILPRTVEVSALALYNALAPLTTRQGITVHLAVGSRFTDINIIQDGQLVVSRGVTFGSRQLTDRLAEVLNVSFENAENIKKKHGILLLKKETNAVEQTFSGEACRWADLLVVEIQRTIQSFQMNLGMKHVDRLILTGGGAQLTHLNEYLKEKLQIPVMVPKLPSDIEVAADQDIFEEHLHALLPLLGTTQPQRGSRQDNVTINLLPRRMKSSLLRRKTRARQTVHLAAALIGLAAFCLVPLSLLGARSRQIQSINARIAHLKPQLRLAEDLKEKISTIEDYISTKTSCMTVLREISLLVSDDIMINKLDFEQNRAVTLTGEAASHASVVDLSRALNESKMFTSATLNYTRKKDRQTNTVDFEIVCTF